MKVLFLDIDGVLNSKRYDDERGQNDPNVDVSRLPLLRRVCSETGAEIVLTSTWRKHWDADEEKRDMIGRALDAIFASADLKIYDKTPLLGSRAEEVTAWLKGRNIESYAILDDQFGGWEEHSDRVVKTDYRIGRGLEVRHAEMVITLLQ